MMLRRVLRVAFVSGTMIAPDNGVVHCYLPPSQPLSPAASATASWRRPSMLQLRRVVRSWRPPPQPMTPARGHVVGVGIGIESRLYSGSFYDDFEDFGELGSNDSNNENDADDGGGGGASDNRGTSGANDPAQPEISAGGGVGGDDAVMRELRKRMNDLSKQKEEEDDNDDDDDEEEDEEAFDVDADSGSALPDLEGNSISNVDDLIGFAQAKAREKAKDNAGGDATGGGAAVLGGGGTWEDENWARPVPREDDATGEPLDFDDVLEGGVVLVANPAKFCSDLADDDDDGDASESKGKSFLGGLFDDPFPSAPRGGSSDNGGISLSLLAKFGITLPPSPDLGPDRRADLLPVVLLVDRDPRSGCRAALMNRRTGNLMGDLPPSVFEGAAGGGEESGGGDDGGYKPHPLAAFMIQPLWWAGSSPGGDVRTEGDDEAGRSNGGLRAIDIVHACPYVDDSVPLARSDGLYWGGSPVQAQEAMKDDRLEKPLSGFDFKFFIQTTRWLPSQLEKEIEDGTWYLATVSKEVLFRSRDRLGAKRAKPLWTEIIELLGDDYKHIRDKLYGEEE